MFSWYYHSHVLYYLRIYASLFASLVIEMSWMPLFVIVSGGGSCFRKLVIGMTACGAISEAPLKSSRPCYVGGYPLPTAYKRYKQERI
jgi:hypothetical protein